MTVLRDYQDEATASIYSYFADGRGEAPLVVAPTGCHAAGTMILMSDGSTKPVENIAVGDMLMGPDSKPRTVLNLCRGREEMYRVTPTKGDPFVVNAGHVLSLRTPNEGKSHGVTGREVVAITVRDWLGKSKYFKHVHKLHRVGVDMPRRARPDLCPYTLGAMIGDGCELGLFGSRAGDKFIPDCYKLSDRETRLLVLAGLLDTDGHLSKNYYDYISKSKRLSDDVAFVARSLGLAAYVSMCEKYCQNGGGGTYWRVCISGDCDIIPTKVPRETASPRLQKKSVLVTGFSVTSVGTGDFYGFTLDQDHLYLTADFTVHHNSGKSVIIAEFCRRALADYPETRILAATHQRELISQNFQALLRMWPGAPAGIYSAGLGRRQARAQVLFAGVQSIHRKTREIGHVDLMLVDEAHLIPRNTNTQYGRLIDGLRDINPAMKLIGATATPYRLDSGCLHMGDDALFDGICYDIPVAMLVERGYLAPLVSKRPGTVFDTRGLHKRGGEFIEAEMMAKFATEEATEAAVMEIVALAAERRSWIAFCIGVDHAEQVRDAMRRHGIAAEMVTGQTPSIERDRLLREFKAGRIRCLTSVAVLTTGFDAPSVDLIAMLRPTASTGLYIQMAGRGMRISDGKEDCIAEGQRVLTDRGLVPIERVTRDMKVWDGVEFVQHCGIVFRGEREVISYAGLVSTPDHKLWTQEGWKEAGECALACTPVAVTGHGRTPIRAAEGRFRGDRAERREGASAHVSRMLRMWGALAEGLHELAQGHGWLPGVRQPALCPEVAGGARHLCQAKVHQPERQSLRRVWRAWNSLQLSISDRNGGMGSGEFGAAQRDADRPHQQRRTLRTGEPSLSKREAEVPSAVVQTKRRVWDILNAGPRHSFTVEGLLVHNCLVLDFAGNVLRHGPVDAISLPGEKRKGDGDGEAPSKVCPECESIILIASRECPDCGHVFPAPEPKIERTASVEAIMNLTATDEWRPVLDVDYARHRKAGSPDSLRVEYLVGPKERSVVVSEWVCFEHGGYARQKAVQWWSMWGAGQPPDTADEALERLEEIRRPADAVVVRDGKYHRIKRLRAVRPAGEIAA